MILMALMMAAAEPSPEALALGKEMAQAGMLATLLPILEADSTGVGRGRKAKAA